MMSFFGDFFSKFFTTMEAPQECPEDKPAYELQRAWDQVQALAREHLECHQLRQHAIAEDLNRERHELARGALWETILLLHRELGSGLDEITLERLARMARAHSFDPEEPESARLEDRIDRLVLSGLFRRCAAPAWERLASLMERAGRDWPVPPDLFDRRLPESAAALAARHRDSTREEFLTASPRKQVELVTGEVRVWGPTYPDPDSWLWHQTALQAVGAGLQVQLFGAALELWLWRSPSLEEAFRAQIQSELATARQMLRRGVFTLEEVETVASRSRTVCGEILPALVWSYVEERLHWEGEGLKISTLEPGLSTVDPVCGMALTSRRIAARASLEGTTYYFCSESCKSRFLAHPERFLDEPSRHDADQPPSAPKSV